MLMMGGSKSGLSEAEGKPVSASRSQYDGQLVEAVARTWLVTLAGGVAGKAKSRPPYAVGKKSLRPVQKLQFPYWALAAWGKA